MASSKPFKIDKEFGPPRLRAIINRIVEEINKRTPIEGFGIFVTEKRDGRQISTQPPNPQGDINDPEGGGTSAGDTGDLVGAFNGQSATFHLKQSSAPTPIT